ncbi:MAG: hypothetical protein RLO17_24815 [Cyclobacteriaceae bacterium]|jgi:hypothetical protein|tara:strand:+ start:63121 stop:63435 length:315 start_codon:yes stop_codon:yes gene_type:complete
MKNLFMNHAKKISTGILALTYLLCFPLATVAQEFDLDDLNDEVEDATSSVGSIVENIIIVALIIGIVGVIWQMINDQEQGKKYLIGWGVAAIIYVVIFRFLDLV